MHLAKTLLCLAALAAVAGCGQTGSQNAAAPPEPDDALTVAGPFDHENVRVFLLCKTQQDDSDYLTLDEGLKSGAVQVSEKDQEQVSELKLDNQSERPLFLQEGDRLKGGKQDRIVVASLVVPPKSGLTVIPTMCVEQGRWVAHGGGNAFGATENAALAPKEVRSAAKVNQAQGEVWQQVAEQKVKAAAALHTSNSNSSLNEALDSPQVKKLSEECAKALGSALDNRPDAVGVAVVVNGKIEEVNVYPNHALLRRLYPRLLQSYAFQAALEKDKAKEAPAVSGEAVMAFMKEGQERAKVTDTINPHNVLQISDKGGQAACETRYEGKPVHYQVLSKDPAQPLPARAQPPAPGQMREAPNAPPSQAPAPNP